MYDPTTRLFYHSMDVAFLEDVPFLASPSPSLESPTEVLIEALPCTLPIFEGSSSTPEETLHPVVTSSPVHHYLRRPRAPHVTPSPYESLWLSQFY